jgi:hypothetical protein
MENDGLPLARMMRIFVAAVVGTVGLWAYYNRKQKEEIEQWRKNTEEEDQKRAEAASKPKPPSEEGLPE